jgi:lupus La protein
MSDLPLPVEAVEADPSATSLPNDETLNKETGDSSAPTQGKDENIESKAEEASGEKTDAKTEEKKSNDRNGNGVLKNYAPPFEGRSKYNPSILPVTDDAQLIRNQVLESTIWLQSYTDSLQGRVLL